MSEMEDIFSGVDDNLGTTPVAPETEEEARKKAAKQAKRKHLAQLQDDLLKDMQEDPSLTTRMNSWSKNLQVVNSLGFGDNGNIVRDKSKGEKGLAETSQIVGYMVKNIGSEPYKYRTEKWAKNEETGKYEATSITAVLAPGEVVPMTRAFLTMFAACPEVGFQLANGRIVRGSSRRTDKGGSMKQELEAYYFAFYRGGDAETSDVNVNSDEFKLNISSKEADGTWHVKPEYLETFGYLENGKSVKRDTRAKKQGFSVSALAAHEVYKMLQQGAL